LSFTKTSSLLPASPFDDRKFFALSIFNYHADWLKFAQDQLDGVHGRGKFLKTETYRKLHTPMSQNYAMGWGVKLAADGALALLTHSGSNGYWLADIRIMPKHDIIYLVVTKAGTEGATQALKTFAPLSTNVCIHSTKQARIRYGRLRHPRSGQP
jgi:hypothetical protein